MTAFRVLRRSLFALLLALASSVALVPAALAHGGEDHGDAATPAALPASAGPRGTASSELFEVVAAWQQTQWLFYVDRYDNNAPVTGATVDVEGQGLQGRAKEIAAGVYALSATAPAPGSHALTLTVETEDSADLLALSLDVPAAADAAAAEPSGAGRMVAGVALLVLMLLMAGAVWRFGPRLSGGHA